MPLFMDVHNASGKLEADDVIRAHKADLDVQKNHGVDYRSYWYSAAQGKIFCLVEAPDAEAAHRVHREAHGMEADEIYEVEQGQ